MGSAIFCENALIFFSLTTNIASNLPEKFSFHLGGQKTLKTLWFALNCNLKIRSWCQKELLNAVVRDVKSALLFKRAAVSLMRMISDLSRIFQGLTIAILQT